MRNKMNYSIWSVMKKMCNSLQTESKKERMSESRFFHRFLNAHLKKRKL